MENPKTESIYEVRVKYKKIGNGTVQCIITYEDMQAYGLTMNDIFERNEKGEDFLRDIIERAHEEVGYEIAGNNIAMQITPLKDNGFVVTFSDDGPAGFQNLLEHLKEMFGGSGLDYKSAMEQLHQLVDGELDESSEEDEAEEKADERRSVIREQEPGNDKLRLFVFRSLRDVVQYASLIPCEGQLHSRLFKGEESYYLEIDKCRASWANYNRVSAMALDFGMLVPNALETRMKLEEHGECLIQKQAIGRLKKVGMS